MMLVRAYEAFIITSSLWAIWVFGPDSLQSFWERIALDGDDWE